MNSDINVTVVSGGGQSVLSYSLDNCSGGGTVTFTKNDSSDTWYTLSQSTTSLTINANAIPTTTSSMSTYSTVFCPSFLVSVPKALALSISTLFCNMTIYFITPPGILNFSLHYNPSK